MTNFALSREPDDISGILRASIGGNETVGYYLVFRGDPDKIVQMLKDVTINTIDALSIGNYADKRGRPQG